MCTATNELRFCTCKLGNKLPENYWVLYRYNSKKNLVAIGQLIYIFHDQATESAIADFILISLNKPGTFDKNLDFINKDVLQVTTAYLKSPYHYYFKFQKGIWKREEGMNDFDVENNYDQVSEGNTKPAISNLLKKVL